MELIQETSVPHWLQPPKKDTSTEYNEWTWEETLRRLSSGEPLSAICRDETMPDYGRFMRWIHNGKHPERKERYRDAQQLATEFHGDSMLEEMDSQYDENGLPKDLGWQQERNRTRKFLMASWNKDRYSEKKDVAKVEVNMGTLALDALRKREIDVTPELESNSMVLEHDDE
ncbi:MAG: hypothetical protein HOE82_15385 [Gammaproteobacteria bacterium]|jgi:hypothetical protein|nr:hypothetical protein [Gammaproteobacteria bacterium]